MQSNLIAFKKSVKTPKTNQQHAEGMKKNNLYKLRNKGEVAIQP